MTTIAQAGILGFGPQAGKDIAVPTGKWYRHKAQQIGLAPQDDQRLGPPEVGGRPLPTIPYKAGVMVGGGFTIAPRLEASLGWLLKGALGYSSTTAGSGGIYNHVITLDPTYPGRVPYLGFRKFIPSDGEVGNYSIGETYNDCRIVNLVLNVPNDGLLTARIDALGRDYVLEEDPTWGITSGSTGGWDPLYGDFEDYPSIPISVTPGTYLQTPSFGDLPVVQATFTIQNRPLDPRQEKRVGSPFLDDVTIVSRQVNVDMMVKWTNPDLYRQIYTGAVDGLAWSSTPFTSAVSGFFRSPGNMPNESTPYSLLVELEEVMLSMQGGIELAGNDAVMMRFSGAALDVGGYYARFTLTNQFANYTWPT